MPDGHSRGALRVVVGTAALVAPALHLASDLIEGCQQGFSTPQLWLNYLAFLPMPWLLLGFCALQPRAAPRAALIGALLYGTAFTYFAHTTLYALTQEVASYEQLWQHLGGTYTLHGALMVVGGALFAASMLRAGWLPRTPLRVFAAGLAINLVLALLPTPDILQAIGSAVRNLGLIALGYAVLVGPREPGTSALPRPPSRRGSRRRAA
jgi:hypothetical protein